MNSVSIGSAMVQHMRTPVNGNEAETYLAVFIALADAETDVSFFSEIQLLNKQTFTCSVVWHCTSYGISSR
jgi:hypothetical protein